MKPLILLCNDDGFESRYLTALADALEPVGELWVVAPERQRSAVSHSITLHKPLRVREEGERRYMVSGSPVDCVYIAVVKLLPRKPSVVVSGINRGFNLGADVFYSGTVAAAVEGSLRGIPGVALSLAPPREADIAAAVRFGTSLVSSVLEHPMPARTILNVNLPAQIGATYQWTRLGERVYNDVVDDRDDPRGRRYYWIGGGVARVDNPPGTDCHAIEAGHVSVTPLHLDMTHHAVLAEVRPWTVDGFQTVE
jgi:5'-nucleotidase